MKIDCRNSMVPTASTQRLTLLMHTCKIRTEDFLDVATSARLSVVVPTCFHVPVRAIGYYCYGHFCYESGLTGNSKDRRACTAPESVCYQTTMWLYLGPITGLALPLMLGSTAILICITSADYVKA